MSERGVTIEHGQTDGDFSSVVVAAHELKAPLSLIRQLSLTLGRNGGLQATDKQLLDRITLTAERSLRLTSDLTRSTRLEDALFHMEPINPQQLCEDVASDLRPLFWAHGREIVVRRQKRAPLLVGNRDLLRRIMMNFSDNALHYANESRRVEMTINERQKSGVVRLGVRDYGPAVPIDVWRTLQRNLTAMAPQPLRARPQSSGLGLYIASCFADAMGGKVGAVRHRDGCTFYVDLEISGQLQLL